MRGFIMVAFLCSCGRPTEHSYSEPEHSAQISTNENVHNKKYCTNFRDCLNLALYRIQNSKHYKLVDNVWFHAIDNTTKEMDHFFKGTNSINSDMDLVRKVSEVFRTHSLIWKLAPGLNIKIFQKTKDKFGLKVVRDVSLPNTDGRTFGIAKRRLQMVLLPIMYKLGVITTLLVALTVITLKGLTIGVILLMLSFGSIIAKLKVGHHWAPEVSHYPPQKDVHIHVHPFVGKPQHYHSSWHRDGNDPNDFSLNYDPSSTPTWNYLPPKHYYPSYSGEV